MLRASSTLWFENNSNMKTVIFLDYWKIKNNTKVDIEVRTFNGWCFKEKENLYFKNGLVKILSLDGKKGSGSVEIKVLSKTNLRVPYAAIGSL